VRRPHGVTLPLFAVVGDRLMAMSGISSVNTYASSQLAVQSLGQQKHGGHHSSSLSDIGAQNASGASAGSATGKVGSKVDVTV